MPERTTATPTTMTTAADALHDEEVVGTRKFLRLGLLIAIGVVPMILIVPGDRRIAKVLLAVLAATWLGSLWMYRRLAPPAKYDARLLNPIALGAIAVGVLGILYAGMFSAAPVMVALGLFFFCRTESFASALARFLLATGSHTLICALVISGAIEDPGFYPVREGIPTEALIATAFTMQQLYALAFFLARLTRKSSLRAIDQLQRRRASPRARCAGGRAADGSRSRAQDRWAGRFSGHVVGSWDSATSSVAVRWARSTRRRTSRPARPPPSRCCGASCSRTRTTSIGSSARSGSAATIDSPNVVEVLEASSPQDPIPFLAMGAPARADARRDPAHGAADRLPARGDGRADRRRPRARAQPRGFGPPRSQAAQPVLTDAGVWKVLDFAVAILADNTGTLTQGGVIGTPRTWRQSRRRASRSTTAPMSTRSAR